MRRGGRGLSEEKEKGRKSRRKKGKTLNFINKLNVGDRRANDHLKINPKDTYIEGKEERFFPTDRKKWRSDFGVRLTEIKTTKSPPQGLRLATLRKKMNKPKKKNHDPKPKKKKKHQHKKKKEKQLAGRWRKRNGFRRNSHRKLMERGANYILYYL